MREQFLSEPRSSKRFFQTLYFRVLVGIVAGAVVGILFPNFGASLKPLGDGFLKLIRMLVAPVVFFTVVTGIAKETGNTKAGKTFTHSYRFTDTWVERNGEWQCVAAHAMALPKK